jgi:ubiquinone/menaquinone biosynthesis C-methylase UbiE
VTGDVVVRAFTELAPAYETTVDWEVRELSGLGYREFIGYLADALPVSDPQIVLDLASGTAVSSVEIVTRLGAGCKVVGLDITPAMIAHGTENITRAGMRPQIRQVCGSGMQIPFVSNSFDTVICGLGTHHMAVPVLLTEIQRVLRGRGHLVFADMGAPAHWRSLWGRAAMGASLSFFRHFWRSARAQAEADAFASIHTAEEWRRLLGEFGFCGVEVSEWPARRFWYPCALIMKAVREAPP